MELSNLAAPRQTISHVHFSGNEPFPTANRDVRDLGKHSSSDVECQVGRSKSVGSYSISAFNKLKSPRLKSRRTRSIGSCSSASDQSSRLSQRRSLDLGGWPQLGKKFPVDTRSPRYAAFNSRPLTPTANHASELSEGQVFPSDRNETSLDCLNEAKQKAAESQVAIPIQASNSPFVTPSKTKASSEEPTETFNDRQLMVDEAGIPLMLWPGAASVEWGAQVPWTQTEQQLKKWRGERKINFYNPPTTEVQAENCNEESDATASRGTQDRLKSELKTVLHSVRHTLMGGCKHACCMDSGGKRLARSAAEKRKGDERFECRYGQ